MFLAATAGAAQINLDVSNSAVQKIRERIADRADKITKLKDNGAIGEEANGFLKAREVPDQPLAAKKEIRDLVVAENEDRSALFREIVLAAGLTEKDLENVAAAYAKKMRQSAADGHWIQHPASKAWVQKKDFKE
jgi:hypothetical protein